MEKLTAKSRKAREKIVTERQPLPGRIHQITFAPSLLASDFANLEREIRKLKHAGCSWIHIDVMDNHFVPNLTLGPPVLRSIVHAVPGMFYDTHLMVEKPKQLAREFIEAGASMITIHLETTEDAAAICRYLRRQKVRVGVSICPKTPIQLLRPVLRLVDLVLVMTVKPGFGGQILLPQTLNKIREVKHLRDQENLGFLIQADGGINESTISLVSTAGAEILVMGTAIFRNGKINENLRRLRKSLPHGVLGK